MGPPTRTRQTRQASVAWPALAKPLPLTARASHSTIRLQSHKDSSREAEGPARRSLGNLIRQACLPQGAKSGRHFWKMRRLPRKVPASSYEEALLFYRIGAAYVRPAKDSFQRARPVDQLAARPAPARQAAPDGPQRLDPAVYAIPLLRPPRRARLLTGGPQQRRRRRSSKGYAPA